MNQHYTEYKARVEQFLSGLFAEKMPQEKLAEAMRYSLLAGGKRIRPVLVLAFCEACGGDPDTALPGACAVELLHTYSLIHDDLPCMDDDDLRRGKPTNHVLYGEATAVLAGDALQAEAFSLVLTAPGLPPERRAAMGAELAKSAGLYGICGGQVLDIFWESGSPSLSDLETVHDLKTAALLRGACRMGVLAAGGTQEQLACAERYGTALGMAFQIADDVLDETAPSEQLGKPAHSDEKSGKTTFYTLLGEEKCRQLIARYTDTAVSAVKSGAISSDFLAKLAVSLGKRSS